MKQFAVLKKIADFDARVVREFEEERDAHDFATLLKKSEDSEHITFHVVKVLPSAIK